MILIPQLTLNFEYKLSLDIQNSAISLFTNYESQAKQLLIALSNEIIHTRGCCYKF